MTAAACVWTLCEPGPWLQNVACPVLTPFCQPSRLASSFLTNVCLLRACTADLQVACAAAIITITALKLHKFNISWDNKTWNSDLQNNCLLGTMENGANLSYFAYMAGGISVVATAALSILQCCTCNLCGLGGVLDAVFAAAGTVMWAVAGIIFNEYNNTPAMASVPLPQWRLSITILSFAACALFALMVLAAVYSLLAACCSCCCAGSRRGSARAQVVYADMEKGHSHGQFIKR